MKKEDMINKGNELVKAMPNYVDHNVFGLYTKKQKIKYLKEIVRSLNERIKYIPYAIIGSEDARKQSVESSIKHREQFLDMISRLNKTK